MILGQNKRLMQQLDAMLDEAIAGTYEAQTYDESLLSKIESKMMRFLEQSRLKQDQIESEREHVHSLISDISHQTKTPLANIGLYAGLLAEQSLTDEQAKLTKQICDSSKKLNFLIQPLIKTSRLESGIIKINPKPGSVNDIITAAVAECESYAAAKNINLSYKPSTDFLCALYDSRWCTEALFNIIDNAVKYTPENGSVTISVIEYEMFVCINITDTGRGINEEDLPKVFLRFWRAAELADSQGIGIGLYLAREIIVACCGYIKVISETGKGSTFSVFLSKV